MLTNNSWSGFAATVVSLAMQCQRREAAVKCGVGLGFRPRPLPDMLLPPLSLPSESRVSLSRLT